MKKSLVAILFLVLAQHSHASQDILKCSGEISGGSLVKSIDLKRSGSDFSVSIVDYTNQKAEYPIINILSTPPSTRYEYLRTKTDKISLYVEHENKMGVIITEAKVAGIKDPRVLVEFLKCR